jgi:hypothetical protein
LAKKGLLLVDDKAGMGYAHIGFVIQGETDSELPETLFACVALNKPQKGAVMPLLGPDDC